MERITTVTPLGDLTKNELKDVAGTIHEAVADPRVRHDLRRRHLWGVLDQHSVSDDASLESLVRARDSDPRDLAAFAIFRANGPQEAVGLAAVQPHRPLARQRVPVPLPALVARNGVVSDGPMFMGPKVTAWTTDPLDEAATTLADTYQALNGLRDGEWTIEPNRSGPVVRMAIDAAGFTPTMPGYYDDFEAGQHAGRHILPRSTLFIARPE